MDRPTIKEDEEEKELQKDHSYQTTLTILKQYGDVIKPFGNLWPNYTEKNYLSDYHSTVWVTPIQLAEIISDLDKAMKADKEALSYSKCSKLVIKLLEGQQKKQHVKEIILTEFSESKFKTKCKKNAMTVSKIYDFFEMFNKGYPTLHSRLETKYMLDPDTADAWMQEFRKFLTLVISET